MSQFDAVEPAENLESEQAPAKTRTRTTTWAGSALSFRVDATAIFSGQIFAWGRGKRILSKLERDMEEYLSELAERRV